MYYAKSSIARFVYRKLTKMKKKSEDAGKPDLNILFIYNMPFRAIAKMTGGMVSMEMVEGIVTIVNGHLFRGLGHNDCRILPKSEAEPEIRETDHRKEKLTGGERTWQI